MAIQAHHVQPVKEGLMRIFNEATSKSKVNGPAEAPESIQVNIPGPIEEEHLEQLRLLQNHYRLSRRIARSGAGLKVQVY